MLNGKGCVMSNGSIKNQYQLTPLTIKSIRQTNLLLTKLFNFTKSWPQILPPRCKLERSLYGREVWFVTEVIYQLCVSPSRNWQGQSTWNRFKARRSELVYRWGRKNYQINTCGRRYYTEIENNVWWSIQGSNDYTQKKILQRNRKQYAPRILYLKRTVGT